MRDPEATRESILKASAGLFNVHGYKATSLRSITEATGFTKGAIYRHFDDKQALEGATFDYMAHRIQGRFSTLVKNQGTAPAKLMAVCQFFLDYIDHPMIIGGCPILNSGVEADDTDPRMRKKVAILLDNLQNSLEHILKKGKSYGQIKPEVDESQFSTLFIASLEGGILLSKIRGRKADLLQVIRYQQEKIKQISL